MSMTFLKETSNTVLAVQIFNKSTLQFHHFEIQFYTPSRRNKFPVWIGKLLFFFSTVSVFMFLPHFLNKRSSLNTVSCGYGQVCSTPPLVRVTSWRSHSCR